MEYVACAQGCSRKVSQQGLKPSCSDWVFLVDGSVLRLFQGGPRWYCPSAIDWIPSASKAHVVLRNVPLPRLFSRVEGGSGGLRPDVPALAACNQGHGRITMECAQGWKGKDCLSRSRGSRALLCLDIPRKQALVVVRVVRAKRSTVVSCYERVWFSWRFDCMRRNSIEDMRSTVVWVFAGVIYSRRGTPSCARTLRPAVRGSETPAVHIYAQDWTGQTLLYTPVTAPY